MSGLVSYHAGLSAEESVERHFAEGGFSLLARRWRGKGGEIDLIFGDAEIVVFVEVKKARSFEAAAARISAVQRARLQTAAEEFLATRPAGLDSACRFDVALVDADGRIEILENAFM